MVLRIAVVGAGPAGSYFAYLASKRGHFVDLYDKDEEYSAPCGEAIPGPKVAFWGTNKTVWKDLKPIVNETTVSAVYGYQVHIFNERMLYDKVVKSENSEVLGYILDKKRFVKYLRRMAENTGANFIVEKANINKLLREHYDIVVDARGPHSVPGRRYALFRVYAWGASHLEQNLIHFWFYPNILGYTWLFPYSGKWNSGSGCLKCTKAELDWMYEVVKHFITLEEVGERKYWAILAEPPKDPPAKVVKDKILLRIGEAAGHLMYHSGEGIRPALLSAHTTMSAITSALSMTSIAHSWRQNPGSLAKFINKYIGKSRIAKDSYNSYRLRELLEFLTEHGLLTTALKLLPKKAWYNLFAGKDPILNTIAKITMRFLK